MPKTQLGKWSILIATLIIICFGAFYLFGEVLDLLSPGVEAIFLVAARVALVAGQLGYVESHPPLIILDNYVYVVGDSYWSFDSREYGLIHTSIIKDCLVVSGKIKGMNLPIFQAVNTQPYIVVRRMNAIVKDGDIAFSHQGS